MIKLRYSAGKVLSPDVHKIGILAIGSHLENHGAALPIDTDSKIASYLALEASLRTGAKFIGILYAATEYDYVKHGVHLSPEILVEKELIPTLKSARNNLDLEAVVLVNGHGGNVPIKDYLEDIENELDLEIILNNKIVEIEGPHAATGEISMGVVLGMGDESRFEEHCHLEDYPEVGMVGLQEARQANAGIDAGALKVKEEGICIDTELGKALLETALEDIINNVKQLLNKE
ncbi:2-amino-5-formylamino-6-ribosylaminopyrimidin-4(3H)-one 5'-monophosphate deformylase [Methanobacterium ferruginis]|uniref:2-amino-5-formylamino-6-ribosylaminopyrimidin- 4(3H)-one 5'-monophosphate deformylase n=1 Tax=Methanobacterium ferruginis TaxID=710191 RepID=UPI002572E395|nr:2-amino-5-formylamino-6-ribosylaminopyrimidin-4(3H)-one 5'-monophosphate deformylase [Methanobacterium ferruginis]BDZ67755.1 2-amino-5-formylamino-6-ribosylaminopyrimidin-4(3H)-one 5'-monophosphate deformylase [Methanobacterium ferruginis]